ncbi:MAG: integration host factor subunit alpha [Cardiobacteriaceae bacterium]|nr:integration host factor subunit alpha [Cardiobacteriaceae bacterium]
MAITKNELIEDVVSEVLIDKVDASKIVEDMFEEIIQCLEGGEEVKMAGFGNFELRDKPSRPGRNPRTGEKTTIKARRVVTFRPGVKLKARVKQSRPKVMKLNRNRNTVSRDFED